MHLTQKKCQACEGHETPLTAEDAQSYMAQVPEWHLDEKSSSISRTIQFKNFKRAMFFVNALAYLAEEEGHHPDIQVSYNTVQLSVTTHAINGLSENDFILAAKIDALLPE